MKKRTSILLVALIMLLGMSVSGCKAKEELREYTQVSHKLYPMPDKIETMEDHLDAWQSVISNVLDGGVTFKGAPLAAMTPAYMIQAAEESEDINQRDSMVYDVDFSTGNYSVYAKTEVHDDVLFGFTPGEVISDISLYVSPRDYKDGSIEAETIEQIEEDFKIGNATNVIGCTTEEMLMTLGITPDMFNTLRSMEDGEMSWYGNSDGYTYWEVSFYEDFDATGDLIHRLNLYRIENSHYQHIMISAQNKCVFNIDYSEIFYTEEQEEKFTAKAKAVFAENNADEITEAAIVEADLAGNWATAEDSSAYIELNNNNLGLLKMPGVTDGVALINLWLDTEETTDNECTMFEVEVLSFGEVVDLLELRYNVKDKSITLTDKDNLFSYVFYKTN
ncbi:MAG: hypothetical protein IKU80_06030 [Firmicutes bacterium]|nr:hypothetical protein [Bacillota bacterium]